MHSQTARKLGPRVAQDRSIGYTRASLRLRLGRFDQVHVCPNRSSVRERALVWLLPIVVAGTSCSASYPTAPTQPASLIGLRLQYTSATADLGIGSLASLRAFTVDADGAYEDVTSRTAWTSSDPLVLRASVIASSTLFFGAGPGTADVIGGFRGFTDSIRLVVRRPNQLPFPYLEFSTLGDPRTIGAGSQGRLMLRESQAASQTVTDLATWTSSASDIATVDRGLVTGVAPGTVEITASYNGLSRRYGLSIEPRRF
jgi:hypothetical protein